jgi:hypothetical protein
MTPFTVPDLSSSNRPSDYPRIKRVNSLEELANTRFADGINALCWSRTLPGDFGEVVRLLGPGEGITTIDDAQLLALPVSAAGRAPSTSSSDQRQLGH